MGREGDRRLTVFAVCGHDRPAGDTAVRYRYTRGDHLGSSVVVTDDTGAVLDRDSCDAWGQRRNTDGSDDGTYRLKGYDRTGYTGQEMLDTIGLVHSNGWVYDPLVGRFVSADPIVSGDGSGQFSNRHSHVSNNPLNAVLQRLLVFEPNDVRAEELKREIERDRRSDAASATIKDLLARGQTGRALLSLDAALRDDPSNPALVAIRPQAELDAAHGQTSATLRLNETRPMSLDFRDANLRMVLEAMTRSVGAWIR